jgi:hypothetical protein
MMRQALELAAISAVAFAIAYGGWQWQIARVAAEDAAYAKIEAEAAARAKMNDFLNSLRGGE